MRRLVLLLSSLLAVLAFAAPARAADSLAPPGAPDFWLPNEQWSNLRWLPFDEARLYATLKTTRGEVFRWVRVDATNTLAGFARKRGWKVDRLVDALVAPREGEVSAATMAKLRDRTRRVLTQGHLGQHILFHDLHQTALAANATWVFGVRSSQEFFVLRRAELSPLQIGELYGRTRVSMQRGVDRVLRAAQSKGVKAGETTRAQADAQLARQLRQVPRWLGQNRYNGPSGGRNQPDLPDGDLGKHPTISADGKLVTWDAYRTKVKQAERLGEIHVAGTELDTADRFGISPKNDPDSRRPHSAYNAVLAAGGGAVVFESAATTFPLAKRVGQMSVLVRDLATGKVTNVSKAGLKPGAPSRTAFNPSISADSGLVAYEATDSATATTPARSALWVYDRVSGEQHDVAERGDTGAAFLPKISGDGAWVGYTQADETSDGRTLVYLHATRGDSRILVSRADGAEGAAADSDAYEPAPSADGTVVAFTSRSHNLGPEGNRSRVYVRDLPAGRTELISADAPGQASQPAISADGRYVAFVARLPFTSPSLKSLRSRIYLFDRQTRTTTLISRNADGSAADGYASEPSLSADGSKVAFTSTAGDITARKAGGLAGVFVCDLHGSTPKLVSSLGS